MTDYHHDLQPGDAFAGRFRVVALAEPSPSAARYRVLDERGDKFALLSILDPSSVAPVPDPAALRAAADAILPRWENEPAAEGGVHDGLAWIARPARASVALVDLLRAQRQFSLESALTVLEAAAHAGDEFRGRALPGLFFSPRLVEVEVEESMPPLAEFLRPPLERWPAWRLVPEPMFLPLRPEGAADSLLLTADGRGGARVLAGLLCELLGKPGLRADRPTPPRLPDLGEDGNAVLHRAWTRPQDFASLRDFAEQLRSFSSTRRRGRAPAYVPQPIDTAAVKLPPELHLLGERLAEHIHDLWAEQRLAEGWKWGPKRDDARREHQDLVAYDDLTEGEKEYDRRTAEGTLKAILALGFRLLPPDDAVPPSG